MNYTRTAQGGSTANSNCVCNEGYTADTPGRCTACAGGKYKPSLSNIACENCSAGTYSASVASTQAEVCQACPQNSTSFSGSVLVDDCMCLHGSYQNPTDKWVCNECEMGEYKDFTGDHNCSACYANTYQSSLGAKTADACIICPPYSSAPERNKLKSLCQCWKGYSDHGNSDKICNTCVQGTFKESNGSLVCTQCEIGKVSTAYAATSIETCPTCTSGTYEILSTTCQKCPPDSFCQDGLKNECSDFRAHTYRN